MQTSHGPGEKNETFELQRTLMLVAQIPFGHTFVSSSPSRIIPAEAWPELPMHAAFLKSLPAQEARSVLICKETCVAFALHIEISRVGGEEPQI